MSKAIRSEKRKQMFHLIETYKKSQLTQKSFCTEHDLKMPVFRYWLRKYRQSDALNKPASFIPVEIGSDREAPDTSACILEYPNGTILHLNRLPDIQTLGQLIRLARS